MDGIKLSQISVGLSDGEIESEDSQFLDTFYTGNKKYEELQVRYKYFVTGRKGTGKTILAKYYLAKKSNKFKRLKVRYVVLDKYDASEYIELSYLNENVKLQYFFQKYYILKEIADTIIEEKYTIFHFKMNLYKYVKYKKAKKELLKHFNDIYGEGLFDAKKMVERVKNSHDNSVESELGKNFNNTVPSSKLAGQIRSGSSKEIEKEFSKRNFVERTETLEKKIKKCLQYVDVELFLDDFDEINIEDNEIRLDYIGNFIETVKRINRSILDYSDQSRVVLLLREDYLNKLSSRKPNIQKTINDSLVELNWTDKSNKQDLLDMVVNKIKKSNASLEPYSIQEVKDKFFPQYVNGKTSFNNALEHITEYSFYRPRDLVVFIDTVIKNYGDADCFCEEMIFDCEAEYSRKFIGEIENELSSHFEPEYHEKLFETLRMQNKQKFSAEGYKKEMISKNIFESEEEAFAALEVLF